jgi:hypothetical protein
MDIIKRVRKLQACEECQTQFDILAKLRLALRPNRASRKEILSPPRLKVK